MSRRRSAGRSSNRAARGLAALALLLPFAGVASGAETGDLRIVSQADVEVVWEGVALGDTDSAGILEISGIPPGSYTVLLRKEGHESRSVPLEVAPGRTVVSLPLTPLAPPPTPSPAAGERPRPPSVSDPPAPEAPAAPAPEPGAVPRPDLLSGSSAPAMRSAAPEPAADPAAAPGASETTGGAPLGALLAAAAGAFAILLFLRSRRRAAAGGVAPPPQKPPLSTARTQKSVGKADIGALKEELRRREEMLERSQPKGARGRPEVIDVDDFEIIEGKQ